jgi:hypothetical protein
MLKNYNQVQDISLAIMVDERYQKAFATHHWAFDHMVG